MRFTLFRRSRGKHARGAAPVSVPRPSLSLPLAAPGRARLGAAVTGLPSSAPTASPLLPPPTPAEAVRPAPAPLPAPDAPLLSAPAVPPPPAAPAYGVAPVPPPAVPTPVLTAPLPPAAAAPGPTAPAPVPPARVGPHVELGFRDGSHTALDPDSEQALALAELAAVLTGP